jgi:hypothetical protein
MSDWQEYGQGIFLSIELVRKQMNLISSTLQGKKKQIRFILNDKLCDADGFETGKYIDV